MNIKVACEPIKDFKTQVLVLTVFEEEKDSISKYTSLDEKLAQKLNKLIESKEVTGKYKEFTILHTSDEFSSDRVIIMGVGKKEKFTLDKLRAVVSIASRNARRMNLHSMVIPIGFHQISINAEQCSTAIVEGVMLGLYRFQKHKSKKEEEFMVIKDLTILLNDETHKTEFERGIEKGITLSNSTNLTRDVVNEPANFMTPEIFADEAVKVAERNGLKIKVLNKEDIENEKMGAFLAVNQGSVNPPRLVVMEYNGGDENDKVLGLVGKGVTFDAGGLSLKPSDAMFRMHCDMAGAGAVLGAMEAIAKQKLKVNVVAVMPLTENLIDANSYKLGDVITSREGKTIEILNTDAEGRLILADALSYIRSYKKIDFLIDIATLTGAIVIALGHFCSGMMGNNEELLSIIKKAGQVSGERVWELPLFEEYKSQIKSDIADLENVGGRAGGSITAGIFLQEFVGETPWVHLDIAATAIMDESIMAYAKDSFLPKEGATGVGTRLLYYVAELLARQN